MFSLVMLINLLMLSDWLTKFISLCKPIQYANPKPTVTSSHAFSHTWVQLFASYSGWFLTLFAFVVINCRSELVLWQASR